MSTTHSPPLSINMVSYGTKELTIAAIQSIDRSVRRSWLSAHPEKDIELVIVDNASRDDTVKELKKLVKELVFPVKIIENKENIGFGGGHNMAAAASKGEYLLLLNTDVVALDDAVANLFHYCLRFNPPRTFDSSVPREDHGYRRHFIGPKLLDSDLSPQASSGRYYSLPVIFAALFLGGDYWGLTRNSPNIDRQTGWISGAAFICRRADFLELEGFDKQIFMYMEEVEFFRRATKKGMTTWFHPEARFIHHGGGSSNREFSIIQVYKGFLYLYEKHHSRLELTLVQYLLIAKATVVIWLGKVFGRPNLVKTYIAARGIVEQSRLTV